MREPFCDVHPILEKKSIEGGPISISTINLSRFGNR
jgi:hypothetical protein